MDIYNDLKKYCYNLTRFYFRLSELRHSNDYSLRQIKEKMKEQPKEGIGRSLFIILNGPSMKKQNLLSLKGEDLMFVNRGFMHPLYKELQPKYHVFVDGKLANGVWDIKWIDQIFEMCPKIKIILPIKWYTNPTFSKYKDDSRIYWQYKCIPFYSSGVSTSCFSYGIHQKFDNIFFTGFDGNGCAFDMINASEKSHFYGADPELVSMSARQHATALYRTYLQLMDLCGIASYCKNKGIKIYNLTDGGILDMFIRRDFNDPFNAEKEIAPR